MPLCLLKSLTISHAHRATRSHCLTGRHAHSKHAFVYCSLPFVFRGKTALQKLPGESDTAFEARKQGTKYIAGDRKKEDVSVMYIYVHTYMHTYKQTNK
jgi:hypothetical protein